MVEGLLSRGWAVFAPEPGLTAWARAARTAVLPVMAGAARECGGTWVVGVDALPNDAAGGVGGVALSCQARAVAEALWGRLALHRAQVSVIWPGYPRPRAGEGAAAFRYRRARDAAHVDGLLPVGPARRRMLREPHAYILGLPLTEADEGASPLVVWEGSHHVMRRAFETALAGFAPRDWGEVDLTETYHAARREVFETCPRVAVHARPGAGYLVHRLTLHGVAPWSEGSMAPPEGRMVAYFRPQLPEAASALWLDLP
ncbi:MAG: hypothetical protein CVT70_12420 [Alphaproteobacteria bacterium HGW-Alphaproteobacteria-1]|jgi:hypothetical protein|nr:MAG: hypothetical protein CVT70_12420 [Alphaproteobacteria bacterium HGW-Alphaproteobacteria-1]